MTEMTPEKLAELRRDAESWLMIGGERVLPLLNALDAARAERAGAVLARVLPDLLAGAWDEGADFARRHPFMSSEYIRSANPYRTEGETDE